MKNSQGTSWGDNGYGYIPKESDQNHDCGIRETIDYIDIDFGFPIIPDVSPKLTITLTDSGSDGWNGNIFGIKQNNQIIGTFGDTFTSGGSVVVLSQPQLFSRLSVRSEGVPV